MSDSPLLTDGQKPSQTHLTGPIIALVVLVAAAYITIFLDAADGNVVSFSPLQIVVMVCSGVVYTMLVIYDEWFYGWFSSLFIGQLLYFVVQFGLVIVLGVASQVQGQWWLMILPVLGGSAAIDVRWMIGTGVGGVVSICLGYVLVLGSLEPLWVVPIYITPAVVFVLIFSHISFRERVTRMEMERLAVELQEANRQLSEYAAKIEELAIMRERNRMAREIHDSLGHYLTVANVQIRAAQAIMAHNPEKAQDALQKADRMTQEGLSEVRQSVATLRESPTDGRPLADTLQELVDESQAAGIPTTLSVVGMARPLSIQATRTIYRTVQEGLTNVRKHAEAQMAAVTLDYSSPELVQLTVEDDGRGSTAADGGFGLLGMRERVKLLGGRVEITTADGAGFKLQVILPTTVEEEEDDESGKESL